ncbi:unnamed protein product [Psylliodes chrysocephalus]|uniref:Uncharacterized protein n=1 Tax=Psylliodes chrysocephalus TaxID=3402493 RepID=A0A9P0D3L3_9CUCU|nr:unnamed protein product [Psylliodes chrysocephala]
MTDPTQNDLLPLDPEADERITKYLEFIDVLQFTNNINPEEEVGQHSQSTKSNLNTHAPETEEHTQIVKEKGNEQVEECTQTVQEQRDPNFVPDESTAESSDSDAVILKSRKRKGMATEEKWTDFKNKKIRQEGKAYVGWSRPKNTPAKRGIKRRKKNRATLWFNLV